jgi:basic amino acid/polyamine antiporter, APA family
MFASLGIALAVYLPLLLVVTQRGGARGVRLAGAMARAFPETFFAEAASAYLGAFGFWLVIVAALLSTLTALRANLLAGSRVALAMAGHRTLPRGLERLHPGPRPRWRPSPSSAERRGPHRGGPGPGGGGSGGIPHLPPHLRHHPPGGVAGPDAGRGTDRGRLLRPLLPPGSPDGNAVCGLLILFQLVTVPSAGLLLLVWLGFGAFHLCRLSLGPGRGAGRGHGRAGPPLQPPPGPEHLRPGAPGQPGPGRRTGLGGGALAPPLVGRILLHQVVVATGTPTKPGSGRPWRKGTRR